MKVVMLEPGKKARATKILDNIDELHKIVGGYIECVYPWDDPVCLVLNEEGKLQHLPFNRGLKRDDGTLYDFIVGNAFIVGLTDEKGRWDDEFHDLSDELIEKFTNMFLDPEVLIKCEDGEYISLPL